MRQTLQSHGHGIESRSSLGSQSDDKRIPLGLSIHKENLSMTPFPHNLFLIYIKMHIKSSNIIGSKT